MLQIMPTSCFASMLFTLSAVAAACDHSVPILGRALCMIEAAHGAAYYRMMCKASATQVCCLLQFSSC